MINRKNIENLNTPEHILKRYWSYNTFRPLQKDIISNVLAEHDTLAILPTGGGKSVCFQVPGLILEGVCLVVSPLIALMKDQVRQLRQRNITAEAIYAGMENRAIEDIFNEAIDGHIKFLYLSPERLQNYTFKNALKYLKIGLLAIDEAHCISKWGYDFRPAYLNIAEIRDNASYNKFPTIALTATATEQVRADIAEKLKLRKPQFFVQSFARENLSYFVKEAESKDQHLLDFLSQNPGSAIVYAKTRKRTVEIATILSRNGIPADFYHAGLSMAERTKKQDTWISSQSGIMVSTNAFGMGIDKANVRSVIHMDLCDNLEAYYQESGRAGRDEQPSKAILLFSQADVLVLEKNLEKKYPEKSFLTKVYQCLANFYQVNEGNQEAVSYDFDLYNFASTFGLEVVLTHNALKLLESQNLIFLSESYFQPSKMRFLLKAHDIFSFQERNPAYDEFIKTILRIYGGEIFNSFVNVAENEIASASRSNYSKTIELLNNLVKHKVIEYSPQKTLPQFSFQGFRYDADKLPLNHKEIAERKTNERRALKAMIAYASQSHICRMAYIQDYFDEKKPNPCGKCDVCLRKKNLGVSNEDTLLIRNKIIGHLPATILDLENVFNVNEKEIAGKIIKEGVSSGEFKMDAFGLIFVAN